MADTVPNAEGQPEPKIEIAKRAAISLASQFASFSTAHPDETVIVGLYVFSSRDNQPAARQLTMLSPPSVEAARVAVARMQPDGGTPIGEAMIAAKQDLDETGPIDASTRRDRR